MYNISHNLTTTKNHSTPPLLQSNLNIDYSICFGPMWPVGLKTLWACPSSFHPHPAEVFAPSWNWVFIILICLKLFPIFIYYFPRYGFISACFKKLYKWCTIKIILPWLVWLSGLSAGLQTIGLLVDSQSGHMPGLQTRSPVGGMWEATTHWCFFPLFLYSPL